VQAQVGGKLAQIGSRLIDATARKMAQDFFGRFAALMAPAEGGGAAPATAPEGASTGMARLAAPAVTADDIRLPPLVWVTGLTAIVALMLYFFAVRGGMH